jgi:hypothetical protein
MFGPNLPPGLAEFGIRTIAVAPPDPFSKEMLFVALGPTRRPPSPSEALISTHDSTMSSPTIANASRGSLRICWLAFPEIHITATR